MATGSQAESLPAGAWTALVTPFSEDGSAIDWPAHERLVEAQLKAGIDGLVPCGTTGEAPTLSGEEQQQVIRRTVAMAKQHAFVLAGIGTNNTRASVAQASAAVRAGADGVMLVAPYYNKPCQEGLYQHVRAVAGAVDVPVVLYNIPGRTMVRFEIETLCRIADDCDNVVGLKDATNNVHDCQELGRRIGDRLAVLSGDDALTLALMSVGATGVISVTANLFPREVKQVTDRAHAGRFAEARNEHQRLLPVHQAMFCAPNPAPVKAAAAMRGMMHAATRLPMVPLTKQQQDVVRRALSGYVPNQEPSR